MLHECGELGLVLHQLRLAQAVRQELVRVVQVGPVRRRPKSLELGLEQEQERVQPECMLLGPAELKPGLVRLGLLLEPEAERLGQQQLGQ